MSDSIWDNVNFDQAAANKAASALEDAAHQLDQANKDRARQAKHARQDWSGATRSEFDQALNPAMREAGNLVDALRRAAGTIRHAKDEASLEQQRRSKARLLYQGKPHPS
jgi:uncharacterized protein YukE